MALTKQSKILRWIAHKKIGDKFTANNIATDIGLLSREVSAVLKWQTCVQHAGFVPRQADTWIWEKIKEVPGFEFYHIA